MTPRAGRVGLETRLGMIVITILVFAFGFLVYRKVDLHQSGLQQANMGPRATGADDGIGDAKSPEARATEQLIGSLSEFQQQANNASSRGTKVAGTVTDLTPPDRSRSEFHELQPDEQPIGQTADVIEDSGVSLPLTDNFDEAPMIATTGTEDATELLPPQVGTENRSAAADFDQIEFAQPDIPVADSFGAIPFNPETDVVVALLDDDSADTPVAAFDAAANPLTSFPAADVLAADASSSFDEQQFAAADEGVATAEADGYSSPTIVNDSDQTFDLFAQAPFREVPVTEVPDPELAGAAAAASSISVAAVPTLPTDPEIEFSFDGAGTSEEHDIVSPLGEQPVIGQPSAFAVEAQPSALVIEERETPSLRSAPALAVNDLDPAGEPPQLIAMLDPPASGGARTAPAAAPSGDADGFPAFSFDPVDAAAPDQQLETVQPANDFGPFNTVPPKAQQQQSVTAFPAGGLDMTPGAGTVPQDNRQRAGSNSRRPTTGTFSLAAFNYQHDAAAGVEQVKSEVMEVKNGDNYWTISKRAYGTIRYFSALAVFNQKRIPDPKKMRPGMMVMIPPAEVLEQRYPELFDDLQPKTPLPAEFMIQPDGRPAYRVGERETLSEISQRLLGRSARWIEIYRLNQTVLKDPNKLKPGTVLILPDDAVEVNVTP